jgi:hypothetical protein
MGAVSTFTSVSSAVARASFLGDATRLISPRPLRLHDPITTVARHRRWLHVAMAPSYEAKLLTDFLVAPASLRDFMTPHQFASVFPSAHRSNPAIQELYRELHALRERDIDAVRKDIADEVRRSKQLKREYAHQRRQMDTATVTGLDPVALQMEQEVSICCLYIVICTTASDTRSSCPAPTIRTTRIRTRCRR